MVQSLVIYERAQHGGLAAIFSLKLRVHLKERIHEAPYLGWSMKL